MNAFGGVCRTGFRAVLQEVDGLAGRIANGDKEAVDRAVALISTVTESMIGYLPSPEENWNMEEDVNAAELREQNRFSTISAFGLRKKGAVIPLHNHPYMHAFLKCVRGSVKIRTFTPLVDEDSLQPEKWTKFRFEGETIVDENSMCKYLGPWEGNVHEITAMEEGAFFFDVLLPGYYDKCIYYREKTKNVATTTGEVVTLLPYPGTPTWFHTGNFYYPTLQ